MKKLFYALSCLVAAGIAGGCNDDEGTLTYQDITVDFAVSETGMEGNSADIGLKLSRAAKEDLNVTIGMSSSDVAVSDIVLTPALNEGKLIVQIPSGATTGTFSVAKTNGRNPEGLVKFRIESLSQTSGYKVGTTTETSLSFSAIVSNGSEMQLEGKVGEETYRNMVYVDLSNGAQTQVDRKSWNLGFYCGTEFRVILNSSYATLAAATEKTDFASVTMEDAEAAPSLLGGMTDDISELIDNVEGDLSKTVFGDIAASESKVFFVASEDNKKTDNLEDRSLWYKVKVTRGDNGYRVEYGKVGDTTPAVAEIVKDPLYHFVGLSLETGKTVAAQPEAKKWDLMWAYASASTVMASGPVLSFSQDVITINTVSEVEVATVMTETKSYADFQRSDVASSVFEKAANTVGTTWRSPAMPGTTAGVKTDRFYVVKDCAGNYYKLQFLSFGSGDNGERGRPELKYELLK